MSRSFVVAAVVSGVVLAAGCAPIDPEGAAYGVMHRAGIAAVGYPSAASSMGDQVNYLATHELGFEAASGVELEYALPLARGFDMRFVLGFTHWDVNFPTQDVAFPWPADEEATWDTTSLMFLLTGGARWGRFGAHLSAGPGVLFNTLEWRGAEADAKTSFALQTNLGFTVMVTPTIELGLDLGYRASRAVYSTDRMTPFDIEDAQLLDSLVAKLGMHVLF